MWWKIYFWSYVGIFLLASFGIADLKIRHMYMLVIDVAILVLFGVGLYSYIFQKTHIFKQKLFNPKFWKYFFWGNIVYSLLYYVYLSAPNAPVISNLSYLQSLEPEPSTWYIDLFSVLYGLPFFYAIYQLSKGKFRKIDQKETAIKKTVVTKAQEKKNEQIARWVLTGTALFSIEAAVFFLYGLLLTIYKMHEDTAFVYILVAVLIPVLAFTTKLYKRSLTLYPNQIGMQQVRQGEFGNYRLKVF